MANTLRFKRGLTAGLPASVAGEPLFTTDTFDLYIGNGTTNTRFQKYIASGTTAQYLRGDGSLATFPTNIVTGTGVSGQVAYWSGTNTQVGSNNLFWDATNGRLGIGTNTPVRILDVEKNVTNSQASISITNSATTGIYTSVGYRLYAFDGTSVTDAGALIATSSTFVYGQFSANQTNLIGSKSGGVRIATVNAPIKFANGNADSDLSTAIMTLHATGNLSIGATTDSAQRLQVTGDTLLKGSGNTSATTALTVQNSGGTDFLRARNDGRIILGSQTVNFAPYIQPNNGVSALNIDGTHLYFGNANNDNANTGPAGFTFDASFSAAAGTESKLINLIGTFSGNTSSQHTILRLGYTINQVAGATGITRGLYVNPTLTAAADWRSIEWSNNTGWGLYGVGTAKNYLGGELLVNTLTSVAGYQLAVSGSIYSSSNIRFDTAIRDNRDNSIITQSLSSVISNRVLTIGNGTYLNINFPSGNMLIGSTTDSGEKLQVTGTMKVTGASTFGDNSTISKNYNGETKLTISNTTTGDSSVTYISLVSSNGLLNIGKRSSTVGVYKFLAVNDSQIYNNTSGDIAILNDFATGSIKMAAGGSSTAHFTIASTGAATFSSSIEAATAIAIGTTPDTNKPFKILKNINATVGINFENTSTSSLAFSAIQMGTDVTGGTKFTNLVYASSGVAASGVYNPDGTSLINNGNGGLNFLGTPTRFYTGGSTGVLRLYLDNNGLTQLTATTPTTSETDGYRQYSADVVAGNAAPHFRTENGAVIKLYQETTGVGNAIFSAGGGNSVLDDSTFDGYTLRQIVKALRNQGILA
jgi:hypothetical protein